MAVRDAFGKGRAEAFYRIEDNHAGFALLRFCRVDCVGDSDKVMPVDFLGEEVESLPLRVQAS